jgi:hypothetical protein
MLSLSHGESILSHGGFVRRNRLDNRLISLPDGRPRLMSGLKPAHLRARLRPGRKHCGESEKEQGEQYKISRFHRITWLDIKLTGQQWKSGKGERLSRQDRSILTHAGC